MPSDKRDLVTAKATGLIFFTVRHRFKWTHIFQHTAVCTMRSP